MKILIIGRNFGLKSHYYVLKKKFKKSKIFIACKNYKKKNNQINLIKNYKKLLLSENIDLISCCTSALEQEKFLDFFVKNKIQTKYLMMEKPLSTKIASIKRINKYCLYKNISWNVNFTYANLSIFKILKKNLISRKNIILKYQLNFKHSYFIKKKNNWKNFSKLGGGINFYYLIHVYFILNKIFKNITIKKIDCKISKARLMNILYILLKDENNNSIILNINMNSKKYEHSFTFKKNNYINEVYNFKNWHGDCNFKSIKLMPKKKLKIQNFSENINHLTSISYNKLIRGISLKNNSLFIDPIISAHKLCIQINKKIKKYDFKKV